MADDIGIFGLYAAAGTFICMTLKMIYIKSHNSEGFVFLDVLNDLI